jgi:hypothetical protein
VGENSNARRRGFDNARVNPLGAARPFARVWPRSIRAVIEWVKAVIGEAYAGAYMPNLRAVVLNESRVLGRNLDTIRGLLFHELVHAAQHQRFPQFFERLRGLHQRMAALKAKGKETADAQCQVADQIQACTLLMEGETMLLQARALREHFPSGKLVDVSWRMIRAVGLYALLGGGRHILSYFEGPRRLKRFGSEDAQRAAIDAMFRHPELAEVLFGRPGVVRVPSNAADLAAWIKDHRPRGSGEVTIEIAG